MDLKKALQTALGFEKKGHDIYVMAAVNTRNPVVKKTFTYLAEQEVNHIREIQEFMKTENPSVQLKGDKPADTKKFFTMTVSEFAKKAKLSEDDIKAHDTALQLEQSSYDFYRAQLGKAKDTKTRGFFKFLMDQESAHYDLVKKAYDYIKDPQGFMIEEEKWNFEGG